MILGAVIKFPFPRGLSENLAFRQIKT